MAHVAHNPAHPRMAVRYSGRQLRVRRHATSRASTLRPSPQRTRLHCSSRRVCTRASLAEALADGSRPELDPLTRVEVLSEALPYLQQFHGKTIVIKYGGAARKDPCLNQRVVDDLVLLYLVGIKPVLVHGGGPEINKWLERVGIEPVFKNGLRVTDEATMEVVEMVLTGKVWRSNMPSY